LPDLEFSLDKALKLLPLAIIFVCMVGFNNVTLKFVGISFYQVARSLTIVFSIIFSYLILSDSTSMQCIAACGVVILGYVLGNVGEVQVIEFDATFVIGVIFGLLASAFVALNSIYVKKYMKILDGNEWLLSLYNNILSLIVLAPFALYFEYSDVVKVDFLFDPTFIFNMTVTALLGWMINIAVYLQIKYTGPLTNSISGTAKACTQTLLAIVFLNESSTFMKIFGIFLCIGGSFLYGYLKKNENTKAAKEQQASLPK
jgi:solute carrier family 35 (GDP-fucose transporter), member C1